MNLSELIGQLDWSAVITVAMTVGLGYLGHKVTARSRKDVALGPDWHNFTSEVREWADRQVAEADAEAQEERTRRKNIQHKYRSALRTLRSILTRHPEERDNVSSDIQCDL